MNTKEKWEYFCKAEKEAEDMIKECEMLLPEAVLESDSSQVESVLKDLETYEKAAGKLNRIAEEAFEAMKREDIREGRSRPE